ncbi:hypothetical protein M569_10177 [Genlisea aurea]|uniref:Uncharacterized protein n=1 Tax=Genlisea aurea TaxID=192259 RepID=S8CCC3_9LAMI|nr:hypothetical protein M569_10177 [Genlisea aurea]
MSFKLLLPPFSSFKLQFQLFDQQQQTFATYYNPLTGEPDGVTAVFIDDSRQTQQPVPNGFGYEPSPNLPNNEQSSESVMIGNNNDENRDETNIWLNV